MRYMMSMLIMVSLALGGPAVAGQTRVLMETSLGNITLELNAEQAPKTVENFIGYVNSGHYKGTVFHRVIDGFMIQGGGFDNTLDKKPSGPGIRNEANNGLKNVRGSIAMARTNEPHSASAQFFINLKDNSFLDFRDESRRGWGYAVFGKVTEGMDVVNKIAKLPTTAKSAANGMPLQNVPIEEPVILNVTLLD